MKNYQFWVNDGSRSFKVVVHGKMRYEAESAAKMMYGGANRITFIGEVR